MERMFHMLLYRAFHAQRAYLRSGLGDIGLGAGQPKLLSYLAEKGPCSQREMADYFEVDPAAVSRMLESLERGGFIRRQRDENSRRRGLVEITDAGQVALAAWRERCRQLEERMLADFTPEERTQFADFLSRAYRNLRDGEETGKWEN